MVVKNEELTLGLSLDKLSADEFVGEILVSDHDSNDQTGELISEFVRTNQKVRNINLENLSLNERIHALLKEVTTEFVQIRTPHDLYHQEFYSFHYRRLTQNQEVDCSFSHSKRASHQLKMCSNVKSGTLIDLSQFISSIFIWLADPNFSSCGFVGRTIPVKNAWRNHLEYGPYCDWFVKKELSRGTKCVISFKTLSIYEDRIPSKVDFDSETLEKIDDLKIFEYCFETFWLRNNSKLIVDYSPKLEFLISKLGPNGVFWAICYVRILILYYLKKIKRKVVELVYRSTC